MILLKSNVHKLFWEVFYYLLFYEVLNAFLLLKTKSIQAIIKPIFQAVRQDRFLRFKNNTQMKWSFYCRPLGAPPTYFWILVIKKVFLKGLFKSYWFTFNFSFNLRLHFFLWFQSIVNSSIRISARLPVAVSYTWCQMQIGFIKSYLFFVFNFIILNIMDVFLYWYAYKLWNV